MYLNLLNDIIIFIQSLGELLLYNNIIFVQ